MIELILLACWIGFVVGFVGLAYMDIESMYGKPK